MLRELLRRADMMVILENKLDALVRLHTPWPPGLIGHAYQYDIASNLRPESLTRPERGPDRNADSGRLCDDRLRSGVQARRRTASATCRRHPTSRRQSRSRACRSRWCSGASRARKMCWSGSRRRMRLPRSAACRRRRLGRCRRKDSAGSILIAGNRRVARDMSVHRSRIRHGLSRESCSQARVDPSLWPASCVATIL